MPITLLGQGAIGLTMGLALNDIGLNVGRSFHTIPWTPSGFIQSTPQVFPEYPQHQHLNAANDQHHNHQRLLTRRRAATESVVADHPCIEKTSKGDDKTQI